MRAGETKIHDNGFYMLPYQMIKQLPMSMREARAERRGEIGVKREERGKERKGD